VFAHPPAALRLLDDVVPPVARWWVLLAIAVVLLLLPGRRSRPARARLVLVATAVTMVVVTVVKLTIRHPVAQHVLGFPLGSYPSGHTADSTAVVGLLLLALLPVRRRVVAYAVALPVGALVGFSRVATGVHTPDDAVGGWWLGTAVLLASGGLLAHRSERDAEQRVDEPAYLGGR
jgi:undecaprenyl-diphosphatase